MSVRDDEDITIGAHSTLDPEHEIHDAFTHQKINIGKFSQIANRVEFFGAINHACVAHKECVATFSFAGQWHVPFYELSYSRGPINIGSDVWIGRSVTILDGVTIGDGAIIGAKAVIAKDVPPYAVVVGNPAVIKKFRFTPEQIKKLLKIKWWDWNEKLIKERLEDFKDIKIFLQKYG